MGIFNTDTPGYDLVCRAHEINKNIQIAPLCHRIRCIVFNYFSKVLNRFKYRHNACFKGNCLHLFVCSSKSFQIPLERML